ncbi:MFS transporter [Candidatus Bipolaricaulota bacterium]|nr:MFS transporter [Candidatus Bipolaricaulota bacterium]
MDEISQPQLGGRRRAIPLAGSSLFVATSIGGLGLIVQLYLKSLDTPLFLISLVATLNSVGMLLGAWLWGTMSDYIKRRHLLAFLAFGLAGSIGMLIALPSKNVVLATAVLRFLFFAGFGTVAIAVVSASSLAQHRGKNLSYISSAKAFGFAAGSVIAGIVLDRFGFRWAYSLAALLPIVAFVFLWLLPCENPVRPKEKIGAWKAIFSSGLLDLYLATALRQMAIFGTFALLYIYMASLGIPISLMGAISACNTATQVLALLAFGWLADRVGRRRIFMLGFFVSAVVPLFFVFATNIYGMIAGYITLGFSFSALYVGATAHIGDRVPHHRQGQMLGLYESSRGLGGLFGPVIAGLITPVIGFKGMFLVMAGIAALGFMVMMLGGTVLGQRISAGSGEGSLAIGEKSIASENTPSNR